MPTLTAMESIMYTSPANFSSEKRSFSSVSENSVGMLRPRYSDEFEPVNVNREQSGGNESQPFECSGPILAAWLFVKEQGSWWKRRYVSLLPDRIEWSATPFDSCEGFITLFSNQMVERDHNALWFALLPSPNPLFRFRCDSLIQLTEWKEAIERFLDCAPLSSASVSRSTPPHRGVLLRRISSQDEDNISAEEFQTREQLRLSVKKLEDICAAKGEVLRTESHLVIEFERMTFEKKQMQALFNSSPARIDQAKAKLSRELDQLSETEMHAFEMEEMYTYAKARADLPASPSRKIHRRSWSSVFSAISASVRDTVVASRRTRSSTLSSSSCCLVPEHVEKTVKGRLMFDQSCALYDMYCQRERVNQARRHVEKCEHDKEHSQHVLRSLVREFKDAEQTLEDISAELVEARRELEAADSQVRHWEQQLDIWRSMRRRQEDAVMNSWVRAGESQREAESDDEEVHMMSEDDMPSGLIL